MTTKKEAKMRKAAWRAALADSRVVRTNDGNTLTAYPTHEAMVRALAKTNPDYCARCIRGNWVVWSAAADHAVEFDIVGGGHE